MDWVLDEGGRGREFWVGLGWFYCIYVCMYVCMDYGVYCIIGMVWYT